MPYIYDKTELQTCGRISFHYLDFKGLLEIYTYTHNKRSKCVKMIFVNISKGCCCVSEYDFQSQRSFSLRIASTNIKLVIIDLNFEDKVL